MQKAAGADPLLRSLFLYLSCQCVSCISEGIRFSPPCHCEVVCACVSVLDRESECVTLGAGGPICLNTAESYSGNLSHNPLCLDGQMLSSSKPHSPNAWGSLAAPYSSYFLCWEFWCSNSLWSSVTYSKDGQKSLESWSLLFSCLKISHYILAWNEVTASPALKHKHKLWRSDEKF